MKYINPLFLTILCVLFCSICLAQNVNLIVSPNKKGYYKTINEAIQAAPKDAKKPFIILIENGIYREKVIIDRPNICLIGENRDSTRIIYPELAKNFTRYELNGRLIQPGTVAILEGADDCTLTKMTVYNNYGTSVKPTIAHQFAVFGRATRTIIVNCNIWSDGNDDLALWGQKVNGMYYHADCDFRCPGVDYVCPRGWCYITRCTFFGASPAQIWHDGSDDENKKLVITNSHFGASSSSWLGRYHHDAQIYLLNCTMTDKIMDRKIGYAYDDKKKEAENVKLGRRIYMYNVIREGGNFDWMNNNLEEAKGSPKPEEITSHWTFDNRWDPEATIRSLWPVINYDIPHY